MKKRTSEKEINALCGMLIEDFINAYHYTNSRLIDIESFVTKYLGSKIVYETFAVDVPGRGGFISDGERALPILRNGIRQFVIYPENVIVIDSSLKDPNEIAKLRFTIAHEAAHLIMNKHIPGDFSAAFHTEYVDGEYYTPEMLKEMMSITETMTNRAAACLLMPDFILDRAFEKYCPSKKIRVYSGSDFVIPDKNKKIIQRMANSMGVSFSTCYYRLKDTNHLEIRPLIEYAKYFKSEAI